MNSFEELFTINCNDKTETKNGLPYLSWVWAWAEVAKRHPTATYEVVKFDGLPYVASPLGIMTYTRVTINDITHEMWLPVMNHKNQALKIEQATMFDINKTIMRCLTKNLAMFGLGLYIYAGEDLPEESDDAKAEAQARLAEEYEATLNALRATASDIEAFEKWVQERKPTLAQLKSTLAKKVTANESNQQAAA